MSKIARTSGVLPRKALERSRELRGNQTDAEAKLWARLRDRRLSGAKFRNSDVLAHTGDVIDHIAQLLEEH